MKSFLKNYKKKIATAFLVVAVVAIGTSQAATPIPLGTAADFAVLGGTGVTNADSSTFITGNVGSYPTPAVTGLTSGMVSGILYLAANTVTQTAQADLLTAYNLAAGATGGTPGPGELGGATLLPGVYTFGAASWTYGSGNLTLDANGDPNAQWIFQIGTTLVTPADANVLLINGASADNVFWQVGTSATLGATNAFAGNILAHTNITLGGGILNGRALARDGTVSISVAETINIPGPVPGSPGSTSNILVYRTSTTATVFDLAGHARSVETEKGFLVIDVHLASQTVLAAQHVTYSGTSQQTADVNVVFHDDVPGYIVVEYENDDYYEEVYGTTKPMDIGLGTTHKKLVASNLGGHLVVEASNYLGSGIMSATLDAVRTKTANKDGKSLAQVVADIVTYLGGKKYYYPSFIQTTINNTLAGRAAGYPPVTITIPAGTYNEDLLINEPNVTLKSASGKAKTIIQLQTNGYGIHLNSSGCKIGGSLGHGFTIKSGTGTSYMIRIDYDNAEVSYCDINSVGNADRGVKILSSYGATSGVTVKNNNFFADSDDESIYLRGDLPMKNINISKNTFIGDNTLCVTLEAIDGNGITVTGNTTNCNMDIQVGENALVLQNLTISNNTFNHGSGINVEQYSSGDPNRLRNVTISNNTFAAGSEGSALIIWNDLAPSDIDWATLTFTNNKILRAPGGIYPTVTNMVESGTVLKAEHNYWGAASGPTGGCGSGASISDADYVDFEPFWTNAAMTTAASCP